MDYLILIEGRRSIVHYCQKDVMQICYCLNPFSIVCMMCYQRHSHFLMTDSPHHTCLENFLNSAITKSDLLYFHFVVYLGRPLALSQYIEEFMMGKESLSVISYVFYQSKVLTNNLYLLNTIAGPSAIE